MVKVSLHKQKASQNWYVVYWDGRNKRQVWRSTGLSKRSEAEAARAEVEATLNGKAKEEAVRRLLEKVGGVKVDGLGVPLSRIWSLYEELPKPRETRPQTERAKENRVRRLVQWLQEKHPEISTVQQITERTAVDYFAHLADECSGQTRNNARSDLRSVWNVIRIRCGLPGNVWDAVQRVEARNESYRPLKAEEVRRLYELAVDGKDDFRV